MCVINDDEDGLLAFLALGTSPHTRNASGLSSGELATKYRLHRLRDICDQKEDERLVPSDN
jgi:hypothetical protein